MSRSRRPQALAGACGYGPGEYHAGLLLDAVNAVWTASAAAGRWLATHRWRPRPVLRLAWPHSLPAPSWEALLRDAGYAPATARRYRQIAQRFTHWHTLHGFRAGEEVLTRYLRELAPQCPPPLMLPPPRHADPLRRGLGRTTVYALRAAIDRPFGQCLTRRAHLPPRPPRRRAASPATLVALRRAARNERELLMLSLAGEVGLRAGQMLPLRWRDIEPQRGGLLLRRQNNVREIALPEHCRPWFHRAIRRHTPDECLFPRLKEAGKTPVSVRALQKTMEGLVLRAGAPRDTTIESLRGLAQAKRPRQRPNVSLFAPPSATPRPTASGPFPSQVHVASGSAPEPATVAPPPHHTYPPPPPPRTRGPTLPQAP